MNRLYVFFILILSSILPIAAQHWQQTDTLLELTPAQADSLFFRFYHHYTINFNFLVRVDSITLISHESDLIDSCVIYKDELVVVADIRQSDNDTVWVKLFRDQFSMGWITEQELLASATPNDIISQVIDYTDRHPALPIIVVLLMLAVGALFFRINKFYSVFYILTTLGQVASVLYVLQNDSEYWQEFYFHPTLNPFILPTEMMCVVSLFWLTCITTIALFFVLSDHLSNRQPQQ